jgi:uncharacterized protein YggT (Ycf19 family)
MAMMPIITNAAAFIIILLTIIWQMYDNSFNPTDYFSSLLSPLSSLLSPLNLPLRRKDQ